MPNDRLRIPQDPDYFHAVGLATIAFARLEWGAVWCCEKLQPGYIQTIERRKKTAGRIAEDTKRLFSRVADPDLRARIAPLAEEFSAVVLERNKLFHGNPGTAPNGDQRLFRQGFEWTVAAVDAFSDRCLLAELPLNALLHGELGVPGGIALIDE
tara:strand:+ start:156 stop:620 length:465 start_codon:yes stop_codon:yes gene_type:complete